MVNIPECRIVNDIKYAWLLTYLYSDIYRLDRLTSGVLMLAKTTETTKTLEDQVANRQVQKEYVCRVAGKFPQ